MRGLLEPSYLPRNRQQFGLETAKWAVNNSLAAFNNTFLLDTLNDLYGRLLSH